MSTVPYLAYLSLNNATEELYNTIVSGYYSQAVAICENLSSKHGTKISEVVERLSREGNENLVNFSFKLWNSNKDIVIKHFPKHYEWIFNGDDVVIISKKFDQAIKLAVDLDYGGDREAFGHAEDKTSSRLAWKILPIWENNKVMFYIKNNATDMYLKSVVWPDNINDRYICGSTHNDTARHLWHLEPVVLNDKHYFYIINRQYCQALKLAESPDSIGDRRLWCHNGDVNESPNRFAWAVKKYGHINEEL